jgi:pimeloyl-ACP methyl ester carboxylesterase
MKRLSTRIALVFVVLLALAACAPISPDFAEGEASAASVPVGDSGVILDNGVSGTIHVPAGEGPFPAVLLLHGFGSSKDEVGNMYKDLAAKLGEAGVGSLRIDFQGFGKSDGDTGSITIDGQAGDAMNAVEWLDEQTWVDPDRIGVLGFSLGGGIATIVASEHPEIFKSLATWSSVGDFNADFSGGDYDAARALAAENGVVGMDLGFRTIVLRNAFFESMNNYTLSELIASYPGAYYTIAGDQDFSAAYAQAFADSSAADPSRAWLVPGGDHIYQVLSGDPTMSQSVIDSTVEWFVETLQ